jgi:D-alanine-D-alanine ligase-like ATP-grasp enzyme
VHRENSHEMFGYDFMVDTNLNVWLIEVNSSPSMELSTVNSILLKLL